MINNMAEHSSGFEAVNIDKMQGTVINESVEEFLKMIEDDERDAIREVLQEILEQSFDRFKVTDTVIMIKFSLVNFVYRLQFMIRNKPVGMSFSLHLMRWKRRNKN